MSATLFGLMLVSEGTPGAPTSPFEVNFGLFFWTWVTFAGLFFLLWKFVWPQMLAATEAREARIKQQLAEAERLNAEGYGDAGRYELVESRVRREGDERVTLVHRLRDRESGAVLDTPPFTDYE